MDWHHRLVDYHCTIQRICPTTSTIWPSGNFAPHPLFLCPNLNGRRIKMYGLLCLQLATTYWGSLLSILFFIFLHWKKKCCQIKWKEVLALLKWKKFSCHENMAWRWLVIETQYHMGSLFFQLFYLFHFIWSLCFLFVCLQSFGIPF